MASLIIIKYDYCTPPWHALTLPPHILVMDVRGFFLPISLQDFAVQHGLWRIDSHIVNH